MELIRSAIKRFFGVQQFDFDASLEIDRLIQENDTLRERIAELEGFIWPEAQDG